MIFRVASTLESGHDELRWLMLCKSFRLLHLQLSLCPEELLPKADERLSTHDNHTTPI
jgi:hypothetical protein